MARVHGDLYVQPAMLQLVTIVPRLSLSFPSFFHLGAMPWKLPLWFFMCDVEPVLNVQSPMPHALMMRPWLSRGLSSWGMSSFPMPCFEALWFFMWECWAVSYVQPFTPHVCMIIPCLFLRFPSPVIHSPVTLCLAALCRRIVPVWLVW
eukprot:CAMPEP_0182458680 /NCGR_PEP_ID=MMETSP1319-20130603/3969_1 /TAXON_ID=172717 /ORGANISM="Bolidomonas pacifica, Strain RCC208" /LENGTH=148 /DNA_ID=CAMNT_0024657415 /DNA_START=295 /DNA_END=741 /DNA_ORIENTATION=+